MRELEVLGCEYVSIVISSLLNPGGHQSQHRPEAVGAPGVIHTHSSDPEGVGSGETGEEGQERERKPEGKSTM